jgi:hypothetical protein
MCKPARDFSRICAAICVGLTVRPLLLACSSNKVRRRRVVHEHLGKTRVSVYILVLQSISLTSRGETTSGVSD